MFLDVCLSHDVFRHVLFEKLAEKPLSQHGMKMFWVQMSPFCASTRTLGDLPGTLERFGYSDVSKLLRAIEESEQGHETELALCAARLIARTKKESRKPAVRLDQAYETLMLMNHFERRRGAEDRQDSAYWLGATYAIEVAANRSIIPGEIKAFVESGHYGFVLADLGYLAEHAGELGAEANHERLMEAALQKAVERGMDRRYIKQGVTHTLDRLNDFYNGLLRECLPRVRSA